jgi:hypothetical protein
LTSTSRLGLAAVNGPHGAGDRAVDHEEQRRCGAFLGGAESAGQQYGSGLGDCLVGGGAGVIMPCGR